MRLPFVISVPHCSYSIPDHIRDTIALEQREILESTDIGTREIFSNIPVRVALWARWSRLVVDLNRSASDRSEKGVVPLRDYYKRKVYRDGLEPDDNEIQKRIEEYYRPYHMRLLEAINHPDVKILFDCHSLTNIGPPGAPDPLEWRKDIILGNNGDLKGNEKPGMGEITCPPSLIQKIKDILKGHGFSVAINYPYSGGYITTHYGGILKKKNRFAIQIEVNQGLYVEKDSMHVDVATAGDISNRLQKAFREIARVV